MSRACKNLICLQTSKKKKKMANCNVHLHEFVGLLHEIIGIAPLYTESGASVGVAAI